MQQTVDKILDRYGNEEAELLAVSHPEHGRSSPCLGQPLLRATRPRRRLAVGEVDDADPQPLVDQPSKRPTTANVDVIGVGPDSDYVKWLRQLLIHVSLPWLPPSGSWG